ncbi:MAG: hypothetical protein LQ343_005254 [Gyalolechia ehrenbergii]|nr:MAG: hypothetical protein LQ343_005254 [Gyalolechia ehrenbergii]
MSMWLGEFGIDFDMHIIPVAQGESQSISPLGDTKGKRYTTSSGYDCLNPGNPHRSECWDVLELDEWLPRWFRETPQCPPQSASEVECNIRNPPEPWTTTFMRIATGSGDWNGCSQVGSTNCQYKADSSPHFCGGGKDVQLLEARYNYVAYTITNIQQFFTWWSELMNNAMNQAADSISSMISVVDPIKPTHTRLRLFLNILTFGLTLLSRFDLGLTASGTIVFGTIISAIDKAPIVHDQIWPKETAESQDVQVDQLTDQLQGPPGIHTTILAQLDRTLEVIQGTDQSDVSAFLAFAAGGHFSMGDIPSLIQDLGDSVSKGILQIFTTYLISEALHQNGWHALIVPGTNPLDMDLGKEGTCPPWAAGKGKYQCDWWNRDTKWMGCESYDKDTMCDNHWWYSKTHNSAYALVKDDGKPDKEGGDLLRTIFSKEWSTGQLLFENAAICEFAYLISQSATNVVYTDNYNVAGNNVAGFFYQGPPFTGYSAVNKTTNFVSIAGGDTGNAFVAATLNANSLSKIMHPDILFGTEGPDWNSRCVSQLNTTVANSWGPKKGEWTKNNAES